MKPSKAVVAELKRILDRAGTPERLDDHPWARSLTVAQRVAADRALQGRGPGYQLLATLVGLFRETMPSVPPRQGKRLDTQWGQFGILTALYFAPFEFSTVHPASLVDAWGRIDQVIPLFVFGRPGDQLPESDSARYRLIAHEAEAAPTSTLSDWHIKGLERLAQLFLSREAHLSRHLGRPSAVLESLLHATGSAAATAESPALHGARKPSPAAIYRKYGRWIWAALAISLALLVGWKSWRVYWLARAVQDDMAHIQSLAAGADDPGILNAAGPALAAARRDVAGLQIEVRPFVWTGSLLAWIPTYGPDLAEAGHLLDLAVGLTVSADEAYQGALPIWEATQAGGEGLSRSELVDLLVAAQPRFAAALSASDGASAARAAIDAEGLSPRTRQLLIEVIDPNLALLRDGLQLAVAGPRLLGAAGYGPQTYLILLQNEDELRATGGFITAAGSVTIEGADLIAFTVEDSYAVDDLSKPYLPAPWQLDEYMFSRMWLLRDSNWSPDFPTAAAMAELDYAYTRFHAVAGVVALDQEAIRLIVEAVGPLEVEGKPIAAGDLIQYLRATKDPFQCGGLDPAQRSQCKVFMRPVAEALVARLQSETIPWKALARAVLKALDERHALIQVDDPLAAAALASRGWDGAIRPGQGDYLMVVDSNIGFNKANAAVQEQIEYDVDLTEPGAPTATLTVTHYNPAAGEIACKPGPDYGSGTYEELIARCYWDYLRVYTLVDTRLIEASPHAVPGQWMIRGQAVPARVDELEEINGARAFGTLLVVPGGQTLTTQFQLTLPSAVVLTHGADGTYRLHVQKQPGTRAVPLTLRLRLPPEALILSTVPEGVTQGGVWQADLTLNADATVSVTFQRP